MMLSKKTSCEEGAVSRDMMSDIVEGGFTCDKEAKWLTLLSEARWPCSPRKTQQASGRGVFRKMNGPIQDTTQYVPSGPFDLMYGRGREDGVFSSGRKYANISADHTAWVDLNPWH
jgi:hypothetical protein